MKTKNKLTIAVASVLSVAALAGTGYAGWVISKDASKDIQGNVIVYDVTDKTVTITTLELVENKDNIIWGKATEADKNTSLSYSWFNDSSDRLDEFFTPEVTFKVKNNSTKDTTKPKITATIEVKDNEVERADKSKGAYAYCRSQNYIIGPAAGVKTEITIPTDTNFLTADVSNTNEFSGTLSVQSGLFGWGSHFETGSEGAKKNVNPYIFYNSHDYQAEKSTGKTYYDDALEVMNGAIAQLAGVQFTITINAVHA